MKPESLKLLSNLPARSRKVVTSFTDRIIDAFGERLYSFVLFGSAVGADFIEGKSDINVLIILRDVRVADLEIIMEAGHKFSRRGLAIPLIFEEEHVRSSLDTFPIEFSDMKQRHICLHGEDPLENATIEKKNLRYQCERELKSALVNLRRGFLRTGARRENIEELLEGSLASVLAACRGMIWMAGKTPPDKATELLALVRETYECDITAVDRVWRLRKGQSGATAMLEALFEDYLANIADLAKVVDKR